MTHCREPARLAALTRTGLLALTTRRRLLEGWPLLIAAVLAIAEYLNYRRHRRLLAMISVPLTGDRVGSISDLRWLVQATAHKSCPLRLSPASLRQYLPRGETLSWKHYYATFRGFLNLQHTPTFEQHGLLLKATKQMVAAVSSRASGEAIVAPPSDAPVPEGVVPPVMYGVTPLKVCYKPLGVELVLGVARGFLSWAANLLGYCKRLVATPEGELVYWVRGFGRSTQATPLLFIHGVGMGALPYLDFLRSFEQPQILLELPNCSRASFQTQMPTPASLRAALRHVLDELDIDSYHLMGHSLGTDVCSIILNDPYEASHSELPMEAARERATSFERLRQVQTANSSRKSPVAVRSIRPSKVILLDPICFAHEVAAAHRLPFWDWEECCAKEPHTPWPMRALKLFMFVQDIYNQQACKRALGSGPEVIFRAVPEGTSVLLCLSGFDEVLPAWEIHDYVRAQFPEVQVYMSPDYQHGGFLLGRRSFRLKLMMDVITKFLADDQATRDSCRSSSHTQLADPYPVGQQDQQSKLKRNESFA